MPNKVVPIIRVFFVTESEYHKLQAACPGDFPFSYAQFVKRVDEALASLGPGAVRVEVKVADFLAWCAQSKRKPDGRARSEYSVHAAHKHSLN